MMKYCEACGRCADTRVTDKKEIYEKYKRHYKILQNGGFP